MGLYSSVPWLGKLCSRGDTVFAELDIEICVMEFLTISPTELDG